MSSADAAVPTSNNDPSNPNAQVAFSLKTRKAVKSVEEQQQEASSSNNNNKNGELVGEDELLTEDDKKSKTATKSKLDCTTRRRACKNCVCGRAELEAKLIAEGKELPGDDGPPVGGCGSCSKGDAFRCATCPYRGQPAWTATTAEDGAVQLNVTDDI